MSEFVIPTQFQLFGQTIVVQWQENLVSCDDAVGQARFRYNKIVLQPETTSYVRPRSMIEETYLHEVVHFAIEKISQGDEFQNNEHFVNLLAVALYQILTTGEGELL